MDTYKKNNAILNAGKTKPTIGIKIDGKNVVAISRSIIYNFIYYKFIVSNYISK